MTQNNGTARWLKVSNNRDFWIGTSIRRQRNSEELKAYRREYYQRNPEKRKASARKYYEQHRDERLAYAKQH